MSKISLCLQRGNILDDLSKLQIYSYAPANCPFTSDVIIAQGFENTDYRNEILEIGL
jgi:hypothetical protein